MKGEEVGKILLSDYAIISYEIILMILFVFLIVRLSKKKKEKIKEWELRGRKQKEELLQKSLMNEKRR